MRSFGDFHAFRAHLYKHRYGGYHIAKGVLLKENIYV